MKITEKQLLSDVKAYIRLLEDNNKRRVAKWIIRYWGLKINKKHEEE